MWVFCFKTSKTSKFLFIFIELLSFSTVIISFIKVEEDNLNCFVIHIFFAKAQLIIARSRRESQMKNEHLTTVFSGSNQNLSKGSENDTWGQFWISSLYISFILYCTRVQQPQISIFWIRKKHPGHRWIQLNSDTFCFQIDFCRAISIFQQKFPRILHTGFREQICSEWNSKIFLL